jgi:glycosyltransferase involved in cell wall biosynthesis
MSNVVLTGLLSREAFRVYQQVADVLVTPEIKTVFNELGTPLKLFECLASGRPTVATRIASHTSIIEDEVNGFLVEPENPDDMARGIDRAVNDPRAAEIGGRGRQTMIQTHSWNQSAKCVVSAYSDILRNANEALSV